MRWVALCLLAFAPVALARKIRIMEPPIVRRCARAPAWDAIEKCLKQLGTPQVVMKLGAAKLVRLTPQHDDDDADDASQLALYAPRGSQWVLSGLYAPRAEYELLSAAPFVVGKHTGYRLDVGERERTTVRPDGFIDVPAVYSAHLVVLCSGESWRCSEVTIGCDVLVRGSAMWSFHGTLAIADGQIQITGNRRNSGELCSVPETAFLGWPQP